MRRSSCWVGPQVFPAWLPSLEPEPSPYVPPPPMRLDPPPAVRFAPSPDDATRAAPSAIATHEASHAIAALGYDIELSHAEVDHAAGVGVARTIGLLSGRHPFPFSDLAAPFGQLVVCLSGYVGEEILLGAPPRRDESVDGRRAAQIAGFIARAWDAGSIAPVLSDGRAAACEVIRRNRDAIEAVARALDRRGFLSGDQIAAIAGRVVRGPSRADVRCTWQDRQQRVAHHLARRLPEQQRQEPPPARRSSWDQVRAAGGMVMMSRSLGAITRAAMFDALTGECDAVISTGSDVVRSDWDGQYTESLAMEPSAIRLTRLNAGAPLLNSHNHMGGVDAILGSILPGTARVAGGKLVARIKLSRNSELGRRVALDLADGHSFPISCGYRVHAFVEQREATPIRRIVTDWEPLEASVVTIPAESTGTGLGIAA